MEDKFLRYCKGETTKTETEDVEAWLKASESNRKIARQLRLLWWATDVASVTPKLDCKKALANLHQKIEGRKASIIWYNRIVVSLQKVAVILLIPLLVCTFWLYWHMQMDDIEIVKPQMIQVKTSPGMIASVVLPDSTKVILNASSTLIYPSFFTDVREVQLNGEAFFSVNKEAKRQFVVNTQNKLQITVFGTEFNVESYAKNKITQTTLVSGSIGLAYNKNGEKKMLMIKPGQKVIYENETEKISVNPANIEVETSWREGRLVFKNTPFEDVLRMLSKKYGVVFLLKNNKLKNNSYTGVFANQLLDNVLEHFRISSGIKFKMVLNNNNGDKYIEVY